MENFKITVCDFKKARNALQQHFAYSHKNLFEQINDLRKGLFLYLFIK
jgi:hypothetical protein